MKPSKLFLAIFCMGSASALAQTVIMGHHLGETVQQFLAKEPGLSSRIDECRQSEPRPLTPDQIHALSKEDAFALGRQVFSQASQSPDSPFQFHSVPNKGQLEDLARRGVVIEFDKRMPDVIDTCHSLLAITAPSKSIPVLVHSLPHTRPRPIVWHFFNGFLMQIDIDFHGADFGEVENDLTSKTGARPNENKEVDTPNLYGAILKVYRRATWLTPELYAVLESDEGVADGEMHLSVIPRGEYDAWVKTHAKKGSLD